VTTGSGLAELAAATPASRDRTMDFLRAASIFAVVVGHWFVGVIVWSDGTIRYANAVGVTSWLWLATWIFQVMPIFFVGGFSNAVTLRSYRRRGLGTGAFLRSRAERLLRPSVVFLGVWAVAIVAMHLLDLGAPTGPRLVGETTLLRGVYPPGATVPFGPLWFLAAYLAIVAVSPLLLRAHDRWGVAVPAVMVVGAIAADWVGFVGGHPGARWLNVGFVLLFPHQLGFFYADGRLPRPGAGWWRVPLAMAVAGIAALVLLTNPWVFRPFGRVRFEWFPGIGFYPKSLIGTDVERVSNGFPPTVCYLAAAFWTVGPVLLVRPWLARWLERPRPWRFTIGVNAVIMTLFLWHMTAYLIAIVLTWPLGFGREQDSTPRWWIERVWWLAIPGVILFGLVALFGRFERPPAVRGRSSGQGEGR
jgi:hypothetical protein